MRRTVAVGDLGAPVREAFGPGRHPALILDIAGYHIAKALRIAG
jgi:hypothetical protein